YNTFFEFFVPDKKNLYISTGKLEILSKSLIRLSEDFKAEIIKIKKILNSLEDNYSREEIPKSGLKNYSLTFYENYLVKMLDKNKELTKKEISWECERLGRKYSDSAITKFLNDLVNHSYLNRRKNPKKRSERSYSLSHE
ncbi:MAG: hypothetical protein ACFE9R_15560, partial [Candidatus Hermodarchaeota archaeon]